MHNSENNLISEKHKKKQSKKKELDSDFTDIVTTSKKKKLLITTMIIIFSLILALFYIYLNSKTTMTRSIIAFGNNLKESFSSNLEKNKVYREIVSSNSYTTKSDIEISTALGDFNFLVDTIRENENIQSFISFISNDKEIILLDMIMNENKIYMKLEKFMKLYYYINNDTQIDLNEIFKTVDVDYNYMIDILITDISESISKNEIKSKYTTLNYNGKNKAVRKLTYEYNEDDISNLIIKICNDFKEDKVLNELSKLFHITKDEVRDLLDKIIQNVKSKSTSKNKILISYTIYCDLFNNIIGYEISNEMFTFNSIEDDNVIEINLISYKDKAKLGTLNIKLEETDMKDIIDISFIENEKELLEINGYVTKDSDFDYDIEIMGQQLNIHGNIFIKEENGITQISKIILNMFNQDLVTINLKTNIISGGNIDLSKIKNSKNINEVTLKEQEDLVNSIINDENINEFILPFKKFFKNFNLNDFLAM